MIIDRYTGIRIWNDTVSYSTEDLFGIASGSLNLEEILCSDKLQFGQLCANKFEVELFCKSSASSNEFSLSTQDLKTLVTQADEELIATVLSHEIPDLNGMNIEVKVDDEYVFTGIIESSTSDETGYFRKITAYDMAYFKRDINVADWWNDFWLIGEQEKPFDTLKNVRDSLCNYVGLQYVDEPLPNDDMKVAQYNYFTSISFGDIMSSICEAQACFPNINREGKIQFVKLGNTPKELVQYEQDKVEFEDYTTKKITGLVVYNSSDELLTDGVMGDTTNAYIISGNLFLLSLYQESADVNPLPPALTNIYNAIKDIEYVPATIPIVFSSFDVKLGDYVSTTWGNHYVMAQTYSGVQFVEQKIESISYGETQDTKPSTKNNDIISGKKYSTINATLSNIKLEVADIQKATIKKIDVEYALGYDNINPPETGWSTDAPQWEEGKYIWQRTKTTYNIGTITYSTPACIQGPDDEGIAIENITELYYCSDVNTTPDAPTSPVTTSNPQAYNMWNLQFPEGSNIFKYYFICSQIKYTTGNYSWTNVTYNGAYTTINDVKASLELYVTEDEATKHVVSWINASAENIVLNTKKLIFGDYENRKQYITISDYEVNKTKVGVLFEGTGQIQMQSVGSYTVRNFRNAIETNTLTMYGGTTTRTRIHNRDDTGATYNVLDMYKNDSMSHASLYNAVAGKNANYMYFRSTFPTASTGANNEIALTNYAPDGSYQMNFIWLSNKYGLDIRQYQSVNNIQAQITMPLNGQLEFRSRQFFKIINNGAIGDGVPRQINIGNIVERGTGHGDGKTTIAICGKSQGTLAYEVINCAYINFDDSGTIGINGSVNTATSVRRNIWINDHEITFGSDHNVKWV